MILSVSRRTNIPAFYSDWFIKRLESGYLLVRNPFNKKQISKISLSPSVVDCIVFWTKNPLPLIDRLKEIDRLKYNYYFQFTVTSYDTNIERNVPPKSEIIKYFQILSNKIGQGKVLWRYDPILLTEKYDIEYHIKWFEYIAKKLEGYTNKCIISFIDMYKKCERNLKDVNIIKLENNDKIQIASKLSNIAKKFNISMESCAETILLENYGVKAGKCVDDGLISKICNCTLSIEKDKSQRHECGCVASIDVGAYNTCQHGCRYCYANYNGKVAFENFKKHDSHSPLLIGKLTGNEKITERKMVSLIQRQQKLF
jgi:DNA repair photolyase